MSDATSRPTPDRLTVPLYEEQATVEKHAVTTGRVRVVTHTDLVDDVARATLYGEEVDVTRVAINQPIVGAAPQIRTEGEVTIIPILEEVVVVEKRLMLKEELHVRKRATTDVVEMPFQLRRQRAEVERTGPDEPGS